MANETFRFGNVTGPVNAGSGTQNIGVNQHFAGAGSRGVANSWGAQQGLSAELAILRQALDELRLTSAERQVAERELSAVEQELESEEPDKAGIGRHLQAFTEGLAKVGALAGASTAVIDAIGKIAGHLGPFGRNVLSILGL